MFLAMLVGLETKIWPPCFPLGVIRNLIEPRPKLIVPEHACPSRYSLGRGFIAWHYTSEADVDANEALKIPCLYYSLRSDAKTRLCPWWLLHAWNLLTLLLATWTLGASVIP